MGLEKFNLYLRYRMYYKVSYSYAAPSINDASETPLEYRHRRDTAKARDMERERLQRLPKL